MKRILFALAFMLGTSTVLAAAPAGNISVEHVYKGKKKKKPAAKKKKASAKKKKAAAKKKSSKKKR